MSTMQQLLAKSQIAVTELPTVSASDNGKVLTVSSGSWAAVIPTKELPAVTSSDEGKVLAVNSSGQWVALSLTDLATALAALPA